jgi:hypothetical protein
MTTLVILMLRRVDVHGVHGTLGTTAACAILRFAFVQFGRNFLVVSREAFLSDIV